VPTICSCVVPARYNLADVWSLSITLTLLVNS
jgi:hypothetical protein